VNAERLVRPAWNEGRGSNREGMIGTLSVTFEQPPVMDKASPRAESPRDRAIEESPPDADSSFALVLRAHEGDGQALNELCDRYLPRLQRWAHGRLPSWARGALDTHDLVQDTFTQVVRRIGEFEPRHEGAFQAYLRQALLNRVRDEIRRAKRKSPAEPLDSGEPASDPSPLEEAIGQEAQERYDAALQRLKAEDREAIIMRIEMGYAYADVAEALGKPSVAAAHMAVSRALVRLAKEMSRGRV
jgi:RNA polymerase sigma factor (sigma-70 family)